ncbi:hypothetical protein BDN71DRAFT_1436434 [Pleurotus eryngii]|uniref:Uncharacterized protein n=1 Tax=Pleurotus eryngii TaxID=5323 RepID=A0A9P5ZLJ9_PLEER|nr:hypothetical protein BDN71DRAFT_1436434 [Pleurotus eryngii]
MSSEGSNQEPNPLETHVIRLEISVNEILELLHKAASNPPPPPVPAVPLVQGVPPLIPYVPPPTTNTSIGTLSIPDFFSDIDSATMVSIGKHGFKPQQLGKLIPSVTLKSTTTTYTLEDGTLCALAFIDFAISTQAYTNLLYKYSCYFNYSTILTYHIAHHFCCIRKMIRGDYSLWGDEDWTLIRQLHQLNMYQEFYSAHQNYLHPNNPQRLKSQQDEGHTP